MPTKNHPNEGPETQVATSATPELRERINAYMERHAREVRSVAAFYDRAAREMLEREEKGQPHA